MHSASAGSPPPIFTPARRPSQGYRDSYQVTEFSGLGKGVPGRQADRSKASTAAAADSRARPPRGQESAARAQVAVDLAGDVALPAADDLFLGQPFLGRR